MQPSESRSLGGPYSGRGPKGYKRSDEQIVEEVSRRLERDGDIDASEIEVSCNDGVVTLQGKVSERGMKRCAEECIEDVYGVKDVMNHVQVDRQQSGRSGEQGSSRDDDDRGQASKRKQERPTSQTTR
jgi:osmotically-inducible protein OsmY